MNHSLLRFPLDELVGEPPVREFRARLTAFDFEPYRDRVVLIPWVHGTELPVWVYLMAAVLSFGEACSPTVLFQRSRLRDDFEEG